MHTWVVRTLGLLLVSAVGTGDIERAEALGREGLDLARKAGNRIDESYGLAHIGLVYAARGRLDDAEDAFEEAVRLARTGGNLRSVAMWSMTLAGFALTRGDNARARRLFDESLAGHQSLSDAWGIALSHLGLAHLAIATGESETARSLLAESLALHADDDDARPAVAYDLELSARLAAACGHVERAVEIFARAASIRASAGPRIHEIWWHVWFPDPEPDLVELRTTIGDDAFDQAWARGRALMVREAIDLAIEELTAPTRA